METVYYYVLKSRIDTTSGESSNFTIYQHSSSENFLSSRVVTWSSYVSTFNPHSSSIVCTSVDGTPAFSELSLSITASNIDLFNLSCSCTHRGTGSSTYSLFYVTGSDSTSLWVTSSSTEETNSHSIDMSGLVSSASITGSVSESSELFDKKLFAFYYGWYYTSSWDSTEYINKPTRPYSSTDTASIYRQISEARHYGIDCFIASHWGSGTYTDNNYKLLLTESQKFNNALIEENSSYNFSTSVYVELWVGATKSTTEVATDLSYIVENYAFDNQFFRDKQNKPIVFCYSTDAYTYKDWQEIFDRLHTNTPISTGVSFIADHSSPVVCEYFNGLHKYSFGQTILKIYSGSCTGAFEPDRIYNYYYQKQKQLHYFPLLVGSGSKVNMATVMPGYDDRALEDRHGGCAIHRYSGDIFNDNWRYALEANPDWVTVLTWNEYPENTIVEPNEKYCHYYCRLCKYWKTIWETQY